ncbi:MAG: hypothetical protein K2Y18_02245 [Alphaproteobacteria bacterium]|jgi:hypothetical protein|nr:hypothetical protein [Alphaproteobacteria bacterium]
MNANKLLISPLGQDGGPAYNAVGIETPIQVIVFDADLIQILVENFREFYRAANEQVA